MESDDAERRKEAARAFNEAQREKRGHEAERQKLEYAELTDELAEMFISEDEEHDRADTRHELEKYRACGSPRGNQWAGFQAWQKHEIWVADNTENFYVDRDHAGEDLGTLIAQIGPNPEKNAYLNARLSLQAEIAQALWAIHKELRDLRNKSG